MLFCLKINKSSSTLEYLSFALCLRCCPEITDGSRYGEVVNWSQVVSISDSPILRIAQCPHRRLFNYDDADADDCNCNHRNYLDDDEHNVHGVGLKDKLDLLSAFMLVGVIYLISRYLIVLIFSFSILVGGWLGRRSRCSFSTHD